VIAPKNTTTPIVTLIQVDMYGKRKGGDERYLDIKWNIDRAYGMAM